MNQEPANKCLACGAKAVRPRALPGRTYRYRNMAALAIPDDFLIPTCGKCRAEYLDGQTAQKLDAVLAELYRQELRRRARLAIEVLSRHITQRRLEILLGLSAGYLSRLRAESGNPSPELVSNLALLARDPKLRLLDLERYWSTPSPAVPVTNPPSTRAPKPGKLAVVRQPTCFSPSTTEGENS